MKNNLVKQIVPHLVAILIFLIVSVFFCRPVLEGNVLDQHDVKGWKGIAQNAFDYKKTHGHFPLWNPNVFSGMPNYQIAMESKSILPDFNKFFSLGLPDPIHYFFIACVCFYILCLSLGLKPVIGIFGALAYAFSTYNPIILSAGHMTKMLAIAYMPFLLAGLILVYEKKYWLGLAVTTLGTVLEINANHPQINFYFFLVATAVTIAYVANWIIKKDWKHLIIAMGVTGAAVIAGVAACSFSFLIGSDYAKYTIRGGKTIDIQGDKVTPTKTAGLDTSYAFSYSLGKREAITTLMPNAFGGSMKNMYDENSKIASKLIERGAPEANAAQIASSMSKFWGQPDSTAEVYAGVLFIGLIAIKTDGDVVPYYYIIFAQPFWVVLLFNKADKFRAPSMTMEIIQFVIPIMAVLGLQWLLYREKSRELLKNDFRKILYTIGGLFIFLLLMYLTMDYGAPFDQQILSYKWDNSGTEEIGRLIVSAMKQERSNMFGMQLLRTAAFAALVIGFLWLYVKNVLKASAVVIFLTGITLIDQLSVSSRYLNEENYKSKDEVSTEMAKTPIDDQILADKTLHFRVYSHSQDRFSASDYHVSAFHRAVGGYHPAKLRIYQDIIERYLSSEPNPQILNMLNAKYIITQNPQNGQQTVIPNPEAYGNCWLVKHVKLVKDDVEEIQTIGSTNLRDTAIVQQSFTSKVTQPQWDSAASISLTKFDNDTMDYVASCNTPQFAVFSEVYYPDGWNAYMDGKKVDYVKTNYVLRGLSIPAGKHSIKFVFEPAIYKKGLRISYIGSWFVALLVLGGLFMAWREQKNKSRSAIS
jgi:hypothetical protein